MTDVVMPGMSGVELMDQLAHLRGKIRVLFMSGYTEDTAAMQGLVAAGVPLLEKPFKMIDMARKEREVLNTPTD